MSAHGEVYEENVVEAESGEHGAGVVMLRCTRNVILFSMDRVFTLSFVRTRLSACLPVSQSVVINNSTVFFPLLQFPAR